MGASTKGGNLLFFWITPDLDYFNINPRALGYLKVISVAVVSGGVFVFGVVLDVKKIGQGTPPDGLFFSFLGYRKEKSGFLVSTILARKKPGINFSTPEAGLSGQKPIKRSQKYCASFLVFSTRAFASISPKCQNSRTPKIL